MKVLLTVGFRPSPVTIEVDAESMEDAWERRYELAGAAEPLEYEVIPESVEPA